MRWCPFYGKTAKSGFPHSGSPDSPKAEDFLRIQGTELPIAYICAQGVRSGNELLPCLWRRFEMLQSLNLKNQFNVRSTPAWSNLFGIALLHYIT